MRFYCLLSLSCLLLTACAEVYWDKPDFSPKEYTRDSYECEKDRRQSHFDDNEGFFAKKQFEDLCMRSKGYSQFSTSTINQK